MKNYLILFFYIATVSATDYCSMNCIVNGTELNHIGCGSNQNFSSMCPSTAKMVDIDDSLQQMLLHEHNVKRNLTAGGLNSTSTYKSACRMTTIEWDNDLAELAVLNVKQCKNEIDLCRIASAFPTYEYNQDVYHVKQVKNKRNITEILKEAVDVWSDYRDDRNTRLGCACATSTSFATIATGKVPIEEFWIACNYATNIQVLESMYADCSKDIESCKNPQYPNLCSRKTFS